MDPVADFLSQIKSANQIGREKISLPSSNLKEAMAKILKQEGYLEDYKTSLKKNKKFLSLWLKYKDKKPVINQIKKISKPGRRVYSSWKDIPQVLGGLGLVVISTPQGVISGREAKKRRLGGEIICQIF